MLSGFSIACNAALFGMEAAADAVSVEVDAEAAEVIAGFLDLLGEDGKPGLVIIGGA